MIQWVYERSKKCQELDHLIVATDDERILNTVKTFGGDAVMTSNKHKTGTERCAEVATNNPNYDVIINIQGDEPLIDPAQIKSLIHLFEDDKINIGTLAIQSTDRNVLKDKNKIKVVTNEYGQALYFSRSSIPCDNAQIESFSFLKHLGMYGYRYETLLAISQLKPSSLEITESLEQLRWMENGIDIYIARTEVECFSVDVPEDIQVILDQISHLNLK